MPLTTPVLTVDADNIHKVDTANAQSLHGMWMVFSKCADYMDQGRRLENLSWRLWTRETFCVEPENSNRTSALPLLRSEAGDLPELSASVESAASDQAERIEAHIKRPKFSDYRPAVVREDSLASLGRGKEKHITSLDLERMVLNIKEKKQLEPMPHPVEAPAPVVDITPRPSTPTPPSVSTARNVSHFSVRPTPYPHESTESCSTTAPEGNESDTAQVNASDTSVSSSGILPSRPELVKSTSIVRGFSPSHISSSFRSQPRLSIDPSPSRSATQLKPSPLKKKGGMFTLGGSSGDDDESSFEERMGPQAAQENATGGGLKPKNSISSSTKKTASFSNQVSSHIIPNSNDINLPDEDAIETDDEVSESAIEDDEDSDWEDSITEGGESSVDERGEMFQRVDSRPNLVSRRSMLTMMMHQPARMQGNAFRSSPALQRSRLTSPSGPSIPQSPPGKEEESLVMRGPDVPRSKPIVMNTNGSQSMAHSPRTTRRNMLATELTESLRRHLLWERQQKSATANAFLKRRHTAHDMKNLQEYPGPKGPHNGVGPNQASAEVDSNAANLDLGKNGSWTNYTTDYGPWEYHVKGW
ncbi:Protein of unknown function DUF3295 [Penicillium cf. griseofulvum]|uniref:Nitrogen regulatory protein areA GATA-like domain-containing protein n=1 Tax=Penicillium cf. griseofulvum TaxID=2972120 RepID=A0A9W9M4Y7_9EURO|nr:Protein of unknown function DUF3295 [Penicillium cf. griseofulvum]KAJ5435153.1 Protein of unknown function DUF3295 [Penicillium cf. griseofulvum]KAJ5452983.1 Protein of unknown function DUF3295 [Penicillium cf. griseofulvum]